MSAATPRLPTAPHRARAALRWAPSYVVMISDSADGVSRAALRPCTARAATSSVPFPANPLTSDAIVSGATTGSGTALIVKNLGDWRSAALPWKVDGAKVLVADSAFTADGVTYPAGTFFIQKDDARVRDALRALGVNAVATTAAAPAREHAIALPRIALMHTWTETQNEGWVRFAPNVGAVVSPVDATSWEQSMVVLAILEGAASGEAQEHLRRSDITRLRKTAAAMEEAAGRADPLRFSKLNRSLHQAIISRCPNTYLIELLEHANARLDRVRSTMFVYLPHRSEEALHEHLHLIELLTEGTKDEVEAYARWHKLQTVEAYRAIHQANDKARAARAPRNGTTARAPRARGTGSATPS